MRRIGFVMLAVAAAAFLLVLFGAAPMGLTDGGRTPCFFALVVGAPMGLLMLAISEVRVSRAHHLEDETIEP